MQSYNDLELLSDHLVHERRAAAERERLVLEARRSQARTRGGPGAARAGALRITSWWRQPRALLAKVSAP
jgi:hypothetical protein